MNFQNMVPKGRYQLGLIQEAKINEKLSVVNCFSQLYYGDSSKTGKVYTDYYQMVQCFVDIRTIKNDRQVYVPYGYGCGLAGGDWDTVQLLISEIVPDVIFCKL